MRFSKFLRKNFQLDISQWCADLPRLWSGVVIIAYCLAGLLVPLCFESLALRLPVASGCALLPVFIFLFLSENKITDLCSFCKLSPGTPLKIAATVLLIFLTATAAYYCSKAFFEFIGIDTAQEQNIAKFLREASLPDMILIGIVTIISAPIGEEIVFRRMLYSLLLPLGPGKALFLTSLLFSIVHFYWIGLLGLFFLALFLQLLYVHTRNLWCPIQAHMLLNTITFISVLIT